MAVWCSGIEGELGVRAGSLAPVETSERGEALTKDGGIGGRG